MAIYDYQGNAISGAGGDVTDEQIRNAFLRAVIDGTIVVGTSIGDSLGIDTHNFNETYMLSASYYMLFAYMSH